MWSVKFWKDAAERVVSTMAQVALAAGGGDGLGWVDLDGGDIVKLVLSAGAASLLKCLVATQVGAEHTAALLTVEADTERG